MFPTSVRAERSRSTWTARWWALVCALVLTACATAAPAQTFPKFTGLVVDAANVLPPEVETDLTAKLEALQKDTKRQLVVATIPDMGGRPVDDYGYRLGREWGVGLRDVSNGVVLFVAPNEPKGQRGPRIEVGRGLEGIVTDAFASQVIRDEMLPRLKANGDIAGAMTAGTDALIAQLRASPEEAKARIEAAIQAFDREHRRQQSSGGSGVPVGLIFGLIVLAVVVLPMFRRSGGGRRYRGGSDSTLPIVLWSIANELSNHNRGGGGPWRGSSGGGGAWGSSSGSDGSWGGGGFTGGGGGDFGGGGASGDW